MSSPRSSSLAPTTLSLSRSRPRTTSLSSNTVSPSTLFSFNTNNTPQSRLLLPLCVLSFQHYMPPHPPQSQEPGQLVTTTVRDYDLTETSKLLRAAYMGIAMMAFMHLYLKYTQPLFIQALMTSKNPHDVKLVAIHVLGKSPEGDLKRPFKSPGMFWR
ncbi:hypothetical protein H2248_012298 [Termitomyces sp. 'cryptogamus']|nr:hypothetical protein H2248_012298 [Termitomyces sp. 'cryptogamus']